MNRAWTITYSTICAAGIFSALWDIFAGFVSYGVTPSTLRYEDISVMSQAFYFLWQTLLVISAAAIVTSVIYRLPRATLVYPVYCVAIGAALYIKSKVLFGVYPLEQAIALTDAFAKYYTVLAFLSVAAAAYGLYAVISSRTSGQDTGDKRYGRRTMGQ